MFAGGGVNDVNFSAFTRIAGEDGRDDGFVVGMGEDHEEDARLGGTVTFGLKNIAIDGLGTSWSTSVSITL